MSYRLRPSLEVFATGAGDVYVLAPGGIAELVVRGPPAEDRELLLALARGPVPGGPEVAERLAPLVAAGAVLEERGGGPALAAADAERFARQLGYFAERGDPAPAQLRLRAATVAILGCGGLGTWALGALACTGVGRFVLVDDDVVELSNLNRQVLYRDGDVGGAKCELAAAWARAFDPAIEAVPIRRRVRSPEDLADVLARADVLVQAADDPPYLLGRWVNEACLELAVPWISAGQQPPLLKVGPAVLPGVTACFECLERGLRREFGLYDELVEARRRDPAPATTLGPASGVVGALLALEVMHLLSGLAPPATAGRALLVDMATLESRWEDIARDPECPACGALGRTPLAAGPRRA